MFLKKKNANRLVKKSVTPKRIQKIWKVTTPKKAMQKLRKTCRTLTNSITNQRVLSFTL